MKKLKSLLGFALALIFFIIPSVNAEVNNDNYIISMINRGGSDFPFTTWYTPGENTTYSNSNYVEFSYNSVNSPDSLPRYLYTIYCGTGSLSLNTTSNNDSRGQISYNGNIGGGTCDVSYGGNTYKGTYYLVRWLLDYSFYNNNFGADVYGVRWSINLHNTYNYPVYVRFETVFLSNEMITDFSSDYLLRQILNQNSQLRNELNNAFNNSTNSINGAITESENNINSNIDDMEQSIVDSNEKTQDVIKDQFNSCRDSVNLFNLIDKTTTSNGITSVINNNKISISGTATSGWFNITTGQNVVLQPGTYTVSVNKSLPNFGIDFYNNSQTVFSLPKNTTSRTFTINQEVLIRMVGVVSNGENIDVSDLKIQIEKGSVATKYETPGEEICSNKIDETNDKLNDLNQSITNDNVNGIEGAFESFEGFIAENSTITQLITMPITLYSSILNGLQSTCHPFVLGELFGTNLTIPCINIGNYLGSSLWSMIDIIISGFAVFSISKKFIKIFNNFSSMKEGDVIDD